MHFHWIRWRLWQFQNPVRISMWNCYMQLAPVIHWNSQIKFQVVWTLKSVLDRFPSFCVVSDLDCLLSFKYKLFFLKRLCSSEFSNYTTLIQLTFINYLPFFELFLILFKTKTKSSAFIITATKVISPQLHTRNQLLILLPCAFYLLNSVVERLY